MNTRWLRHHGYTPSQLFLGFDARLDGTDWRPGDLSRASGMEEQMALGGPAADLHAHEVNTYPLTKPEAIALRFDGLKHRQQQALRRIRHHHGLSRARLASTRLALATPQVGDIVLLKNTSAHIPKLKPRALAGLFRITKMARGGRSAWVADLATGITRGRYSLDHMRVYNRRGEPLIGDPPEA
ncbi:hypothetical protein Dda_7035 [Drechslerella dactyloides]|uniref:Uncharacterized protein n=1 Tax=Drechslerella dactyloides TaxID=74499 RepID=A0AAD6IV15_DREDA|nr:hypothetical protein Dda_7035 [Drechslerella dactyloides]